MSKYVVYLRYQDDSLDMAMGHRSIKAATRAFRAAAEVQRRRDLTATLHVPRGADEQGNPVLNEYPDYHLSLGPRGVQVEYL